MSRIALLLLVSLPAPALPAAVRAGDWRRPVDGHVLRAFALASDPYARGQHRGVDLVAPPGTRVRSACAGRVSFAGSVPRRGRTLSVRCGALVATYQGLAAIGVGRGERVARGTSLGAVGRSRDPRNRRPHLHLGVRELASGRYVDPLTLMGDPRPTLPLLPPARGPRLTPPVRAPRAPAPRFAPLPRYAPAPRLFRAPGAVAPSPAPAPRAVALGEAPRGPAHARAWVGGAPAPPRAGPPLAGPPGRAPPPHGPDAPLTPDPQPYGAPQVPWVVWAGLVAVGLALPIGGSVALRRRRRVAARRAAAAPRHA